MKWLAVVAVLLALLAYRSRHLTVREHADYTLIEDGVPHFRSPANGLAVHWRRLGDEVAAPRGVVITVHGYAEHSGYYEDISVSHYNPAGLQVYAMDHVGHGRSEGERAYVANAFNLADDVNHFVRTVVVPRHPGLPVFVHGHSFGGMLTILAVQNAPELYTAAYLEAPLVRVHPSTAHPVLRAIGRALAWLPKFAAPGSAMPLKLFTRNQSMFARWAADPLRSGGDIRVGTGLAIMDGEEYIATLNVTWPFFLATGDDDHGCDFKGGVEFYQRARTPAHLKQLKVYPGLRHTLKWEPESEEVKRDAVAFLTSFLPQSK